MSETAQEPLHRILIASANPLFARGLQKMVADRWVKQGAEVRLAVDITEALHLLDEWKPDLAIVDYDDHSIKRADFLDHFISANSPMQVMLVSLRASGEVVVYDRRTLTSDQAQHWLDLPRSSEPDGSLGSVTEP